MTATLPATFRALRHRNFRLFLFGQLVSLTGSWMQSLAQSWLVWRLSESAFLLGLVGFCQMGPVLVLGLVGGLAADRYDRHRIVLLTQAAALLQAGLLAGLTLTHLVTVPSVLALALLLGVINAFDMPGRQSLLVQLVAREDLPNGIALNSSVFNGTRIVGPAIAGFVVGHWGEGACFAINAASYVAVLGALLAMRVERRPPSAGPARPWAQLKAGFAYASATPHVRLLLLLMAACGAFGISYLSFLPAVAGGVLKSDARGLGILMACAGGGALAAALVLARRRDLRGLRTGVPVCAAAFGALLVSFAFSRSFALSALLVAALGFAMMAQMAGTNTLLQSLVPDELRGRLMSLYTMTVVGTSPVGALVMGRASSWVGLPAVLAAGGVVVLLSGLALILPLRRALAGRSTPAAVPGGAGV